MVKAIAPLALSTLAANSLAIVAGQSAVTAGVEGQSQGLSLVPLLDLGPLEEGVLVCRPSARNRSPYVGDVMISSGPHAGRTAVTHLPNLDSGGKCRPGVRLLCRRQPGVTPDSMGKFGTPKCELVCQLLRCEEPENANFNENVDAGGAGGVWVSAHPSIGEKLVAALIQRGAFDDRLVAPVEAPASVVAPLALGQAEAESDDETEHASSREGAGAMVVAGGAAPDSNALALSLAVVVAPTSPPKSPLAIQSQVTVRRQVSTSVSGGYRPDFRVLHADGSSTVLETKQVVDTDYHPLTAAFTAQQQAPLPVYAPHGSSNTESGGDGGLLLDNGRQIIATQPINDGGNDAHTVSGDGSNELALALVLPSPPAPAPYSRAGIFPWGKRGQKGPNGEGVVSARAIEHLRELTSIAQTAAAATTATAPLEHAAVVLMAGRHDVYSVRPNGAACPSFASYLAAAADAGVRVLAHKCRWGEGVDVGKAFDGGPVQVLVSNPLAPGDEVAFPKPGSTPKKKRKPKATAKAPDSSADASAAPHDQSEEAREAREESAPKKKAASKVAAAKASHSSASAVASSSLPNHQSEEAVAGKASAPKKKTTPKAKASKEKDLKAAVPATTSIKTEAASGE